MTETMQEVRVIHNRIGGKEVATHKTLDDVEPATGQLIATIPRSSSDDVAAAVDAARAAQPEWGNVPLEERCQILRNVADRLETELDALAALESMDTGKPITLARTVDIPRAVLNFRFFADCAVGQEPETHDMEGGHNYTHRRPVGVVGLVTPWNLPLYLLSWKVAPALAMGNAVVAKPSELTPLTADALGRILDEAGLPPGLFNLVHGLGPEAGQALVEHPDVGAISFTGGTATGRQVAATAAPLFKKLSLELGGKNPAVVFADCDLDHTTPGLVRAGFTNQGQVCLCSSRILVQEPIFDDVRDRLVDAVESMRIGDPRDPETQLGSLVSQDHRSKVEGYLKIAAQEGTIHCGGTEPRLQPPLDQGAFLNPAVVTGLDQSSRCIQEEIFGPVVTLQPFRDEAEAIHLANDVPYGLAATVWTEDLGKAKRVSEALETGMVWINDWLKRDLRVPFGGMKQSGVGREGGRHSLEFFSEARNIYHPA